MRDLLRGGGVDLAFDTVFPALAYERRPTPSCCCANGATERRSTGASCLSAKNTPIRGLSDLVGRTLAFERPDLPPPISCRGRSCSPPACDWRSSKRRRRSRRLGTVGYVFAGSENNLVVWVHRRLVAAGAFSDIDWDQSEDMPPESRTSRSSTTAHPCPARSWWCGLACRRCWRSRSSRPSLAADTDAVGMAALKARKVARYDELIGEAAAGVDGGTAACGGSPTESAGCSNCGCGSTIATSPGSCCW